VTLNLFLTALIYATALVVPAQEATDASVQTKIVALEKAWNQAYKFGDKRALDALLDNEITLVNDDGSVQTKSQFLADIKKSNSAEQQVSPESISVHVFGNAATATGIFRVKGIEGGKPYLHRDRFVDTWVNKDGKWVCVSASATSILH
jgi:ketosteroid isomerase-like protein